MSYQEEFATAMASQGVAIDAGMVPDQATVDNDLNQLSDWLTSLETDTLAAIDRVTADFPVKAHLADPSVGVAPNLGALLQAFDNLESSIPVSSTLNMMRAASTQAAAAAEGVA
ncbi:hypothetical protein [Streptomyces sp. NPDC060031]|uniref:hypothetical protein n=1 Tax=Streptomyces sp. NPDC060031 TaxID=3347043 RepID=UPI0036CDEEAC